MTVFGVPAERGPRTLDDRYLTHVLKGMPFQLPVSTLAAPHILDLAKGLLTMPMEAPAGSIPSWRSALPLTRTPRGPDISRSLSASMGAWRMGSCVLRPPAG